MDRYRIISLTHSVDRVINITNYHQRLCTSNNNYNGNCYITIFELLEKVTNDRIRQESISK